MEILVSMVSAIIPAFNEASRIRDVIRPLEEAGIVAEVIVVDDGSEDGTADAASQTSAKVIRLTENKGKAAAMTRGVLEAKYDILLFLDADLRNVSAAHIAKIVEPVRSGRKEMFIGITERKSFWLNRILHFFPLISGQRALTRALWDAVPLEYKTGFQIEIALNYFSRKFKKGSGSMLLSGVGHTTKEKKYGAWDGFWSRLKMDKDIIAISVRLYIVKTIADFVRVPQFLRVWK